jgi:hypothetical protein
LTIECELAVQGAVLTANETEYGGFTATRNTHQSRDFATRNAKREVAQNGSVPIAEAEVFQFNQQWRVGQCHVRKKTKAGVAGF